MGRFTKVGGLRPCDLRGAGGPDRASLRSILRLGVGRVILGEPYPGEVCFGLVYGVGIVLGLSALWVIYTSMGVWDKFIAHRSAHYGRDIPWAAKGLGRFYVSKDISIFAIGILAVLVWCLVRPTDAAA